MAIHKHSVHDSMCSHILIILIRSGTEKSQEKSPGISSQASLRESLQNREVGESSPGQEKEKVF